MSAHDNSPGTDLEAMMEEVLVQRKIESRQLEGLTALSSPDQVKGIFTEIVTGE